MTTEATGGVVTASMVIQLGPLMKPDGRPFTGDLQTFADGLTAYVARNLESFADSRHGDTFVALTLKRGDETVGGEFRSGHYVKDVKDDEAGR
jgi:hypothetical protein